MLQGSDGTAPPPTTAAPPPTGCGSPQWAEDKWCDDENNNADCNWDGGACCNNGFSDWNNYCSGIQDQMFGLEFQNNASGRHILEIKFCLNIDMWIQFHQFA